MQKGNKLLEMSVYSIVKIDNESANKSTHPKGESNTNHKVNLNINLIV